MQITCELWYGSPRPCSCLFCIHSEDNWTWRCQREYSYSPASGRNACSHGRIHHTWEYWICNGFMICRKNLIQCCQKHFSADRMSLLIKFYLKIFRISRILALSRWACKILTWSIGHHTYYKSFSNQRKNDLIFKTGLFFTKKITTIHFQTCEDSLLVCLGYFNTNISWLVHKLARASSNRKREFRVCSCPRPAPKAFVAKR